MARKWNFAVRRITFLNHKIHRSWSVKTEDGMEQFHGVKVVQMKSFILKIQSYAKASYSHTKQALGSMTQNIIRRLASWNPKYWIKKTEYVVFRFYYKINIGQTTVTVYNAQGLIYTSWKPMIMMASWNVSPYQNHDMCRTTTCVVRNLM